MWGTKNPHVSWFWDLGTCPTPPPKKKKPTLFIFGDTRTPTKKQEHPGKFWKHIIVVNVGNIFCFLSICIIFWKFEIWNFENLMFYQDWWRWGSKNDNIWLNKISKILDMNFVSIKKMEWKFGQKHIGLPGSVTQAHRMLRECHPST